MRFLFVDRIIALEPRVSISGLKHITGEDSCLRTDANGRLTFIPSLIGEAIGQLAAWNAMSAYDFTLRPVAGVVAKALVYREAYVGETLRLEAELERLDETAVQYNGRAFVGNELVFEVIGALGPQLPMSDFIDPAVVAQQFNEIYRPTDALEPLSQALEVFLPAHAPSPISLQFDRLISVMPGESMHAQKLVTRAAPYFPDHFPLKPVLPMTVLLAAQLALAEKFVALSQATASFKPRIMQKMKMNGFIMPGDVVDCYLALKSLTEHECILSFRAEVAGKRVCVMELVMHQDA